MSQMTRSEANTHPPTIIDPHNMTPHTKKVKLKYQLLTLLANNNFTTSAQPLSAAQWRGVSPSSSLMFRFDFTYE